MYNSKLNQWFQGTDESSDESELSGSWKVTVSSRENFQEKYDESNDFVIIDKDRSSEGQQDDRESIISSKSNDTSNIEEKSFSVHIEDGFIVDELSDPMEDYNGETLSQRFLLEDEDVSLGDELEAAEKQFAQPDVIPEALISKTSDFGGSRAIIEESFDSDLDSLLDAAKLSLNGMAENFRGVFDNESQVKGPESPVRPEIEGINVDAIDDKEDISEHDEDPSLQQKVEEQIKTSSDIAVQDSNEKILEELVVLVEKSANYLGDWENMSYKIENVANKEESDEKNVTETVEERNIEERENGIVMTSNERGEDSEEDSSSSDAVNTIDENNEIQPVLLGNMSEALMNELLYDIMIGLPINDKSHVSFEDALNKEIGRNSLFLMVSRGNCRSCRLSEPIEASMRKLLSVRASFLQCYHAQFEFMDSRLESYEQMLNKAEKEMDRLRCYSCLDENCTNVRLVLGKQWQLLGQRIRSSQATLKCMDEIVNLSFLMKGQAEIFKESSQDDPKVLKQFVKNMKILSYDVGNVSNAIRTVNSFASNENVGDNQSHNEIDDSISHATSVLCKAPRGKMQCVSLFLSIGNLFHRLKDLSAELISWKLVEPSTKVFNKTLLSEIIRSLTISIDIMRSFIVSNSMPYTDIENDLYMCDLYLNNCATDAMQERSYTTGAPANVNLVSVSKIRKNQFIGMVFGISLVVLVFAYATAQSGSIFINYGCVDFCPV